jgi:hypothetical protein
MLDVKAYTKRKKIVIHSYIIQQPNPLWYRAFEHTKGGSNERNLKKSRIREESSKLSKLGGV